MPNKWDALYSFIIALIMVFMLAPVLMIIPASFAGSNMFSFPPAGFTLQHYAALINDGMLLASVGTTLYIGVASTVLATAVGVLAALGIVKGNLPCRDFMESFFLGPLIVPLVTTGIGLLIFFVPLGLLGTSPAIILAHSIVISPYVVRIACASLRHSDPVLEEAAIVHGAGAWDVFRTVIFPQMRPSLISGALLAFLVSIDEYTVTVFLVQVDLVTMPIRIFQYIMLDINPVVTALASVTIIVTGIFVVLLERRYNIHRYLAL